MISRKKKICADCGVESFIWSLKRCKKCSMKGVKKKTYTKEPTGELPIFNKIWDERPRKCVVCTNSLGEFNVSYFSHILGKGAYPNMRLEEENIQLKCIVHHFQWDFTPKSELKLDDRWNKIFELEEKLKIISNGKT